MAQNDSELEEIFRTEAGFNDTTGMNLLEVLQSFDDGSGGGIYQVKLAITAYKDKAVEEVLDRLEKANRWESHSNMVKTLEAERNRLKGEK